MDTTFFSVENIPGCNAKAIFDVDSSAVFREQSDVVPRIVGKYTYMPWGQDDQLPYNIIDLVESDETLSTCQQFNSEICYGAGLRYDCADASVETQTAVENFCVNADMASYFLGCCQDMKHFGFCVSVLFLNRDGDKIVSIARREACYCRFEVADSNGNIPAVFYANWRKSAVIQEEVERIPLLDRNAPLADLCDRVAVSPARKFAVVTRIPTVDSTYYPIPHYAAIFRGKWYDIKRLIAIAKHAKLKNSAPIKYHIEFANRYWDDLFRSERITDRRLQQERIVQKKQEILDFLTGAENSGKALFSAFFIDPSGHEQHDIRITKIDDSKEGGDWATDIQEAVNMLCFALRVHSNLVGSVPGKSQTNNSGSDKRELYTIAQALQKPYRDLLFTVHRIVIRFNGWEHVEPVIPFIQLTTLDEHADARQVKID